MYFGARQDKIPILGFKDERLRPGLRTKLRAAARVDDRVRLRAT